jgi:hypothetical protein
VQQGLNTFRVLPSRKDFASVEEVHRIISLMRQEGPKLTEATQQLVDELDQGIALDADKSAVDAAATTFWTKDMLIAINKLAGSHFKDCASQIGMPEDVYLNTAHRHEF